MSSANTIQIAALKKQIDFTKNEIIQRGLDIKVLRDNGQPVSKIVKKLMQRIDEMARLLKDIRIKNVTVNNSLLSGLSNEMKKLISEKEAEIASAEGLAAPPPLAPAKQIAASAPLLAPVAAPVTQVNKDKANEITKLIHYIYQRLGYIYGLIGVDFNSDVRNKANYTNKLPEVQSTIQIIDAGIAKASTLLEKINKNNLEQFVNNTTKNILDVTFRINEIKSTINSIKNGSAPAASVPISASSSASASVSNKPQSDNAFKESSASIKKINLLLAEVEEKANDKNKLSEVQSMIQTIEAEIAKASESISKIDIGHYKSYVNGTTAEIVRATATKNALQRKVNLIKNGSTSASASASASASQPSGPKSVSLHVPVLSQGKQAVSASGKLEAGPAAGPVARPAGPKIVRLVRKRDDNGTLTYTATIVQSSISEQLPTNKRWITPGGVSVPALTVNPLFNPLSKGGRKRTHKRK